MPLVRLSRLAERFHNIEKQRGTIYRQERWMLDPPNDI
jgi:hypothetical protein